MDKQSVIVNVAIIVNILITIWGTIGWLLAVQFRHAIKVIEAANKKQTDAMERHISIVEQACDAKCEAYRRFGAVLDMGVKDSARN